MRGCILMIAFLIISGVQAQQLAVLKYSGGGDWYSNPSSLPNLISYCNENLGTTLSDDVATVEPSSSDIFQYPFVHMTGHGNVLFQDLDIENLRDYLLSGGFLHIDDNYGMQEYLDKEIVKLFPNKTFVELPVDHPIFNSYASFPKGLPKIHEHEGSRPQAKGIFHEGRLILLFTVESDLGDGWESPEVHNDSPEVRKKALDMGANIIKYVFQN
ncbi:hypothetical protein BST97_02625 [Nonlabens spongiae]|uniref:DUF4159 domain-containing protein n=1 Tax=Nonlabens spongiae TaxID=331648 RepID=A0A1W6MHC2_9FLAO|nr:DUF4159 domain-containing protein [Nonlabens spongiae]ARN76982.1 hypothetical protein BST97_02625 [Nonlabens spongiae]